MGAQEDPARESRWRTALLSALCLASVVGAYAIWRGYVDPLNYEALQSGDGPEFFSGIVLVPVLAIPAVLIAAHLTQRRYLWAAAALAAPLAMAAIAMVISSELDEQRESKAIFERYTHRFPDEELGAPRILDHDSGYLTVCAAQEKREPTDFCVEIIPDHPRGREVQGGFRVRVDEIDPEFGFISAEPFDCFGHPGKGCAGE